MAVISSLAVKLTLETKGFLDGAEKVLQKGKTLAGSLASFAAKATLISGAITAIGSAAGVLVGKLFAKSAAPINNLADRFGVTTESIIAFQRAAKDLDLDTGVVGVALDSLSGRLAEVQGGSIAATRAFERLGLNGNVLAALPLNESLIQVAEALSKTEDSSKRAALAVGVFRDNTEQVLPLLSVGAKGFNDAATSARNMGESFSRIQGEQLVQAAKAFDDIKTAVEGVVRQVAIKLAPAFIAVGEKVKEFVRSFDLSAFADTVLEGIKNFVSFAIDGFFQVKAAFLKFTLEIVRAWKKLMNVLLQDTSGLTAVESVLLTSLGNVNRDEFNAQLAVQKAFEDMQAGAAAVAQKFIDIKTAGGALPDVARKLELLKKGDQIINETRTPLEKFNERIAELQGLLRFNAIEWGEFGRAASAALDELERANQLGQLNLAEGLQRGTKEAQQAITQFELRNRLQELREKPDERIARNVEEAKRIQQRQLAVQEQIAEFLRPRRAILGVEF